MNFNDIFKTSFYEAFTNVQNFGYSDEGETVADEVVDFGAHNFLK